MHLTIPLRHPSHETQPISQQSHMLSMVGRGLPCHPRQLPRPHRSNVVTWQRHSHQLLKQTQNQLQKLHQVQTHLSRPGSFLNPPYKILNRGLKNTPTNKTFSSKTTNLPCSLKSRAPSQAPNKPNTSNADTSSFAKK
jgi:hypothetical protein